MRWMTCCAIGVVCLLTVPLTLADSAYVPGELLVKYRNGSTVAIAASKGLQALRMQEQDLQALHVRHELTRVTALSRKAHDGRSPKRQRAGEDPLQNVYRLVFEDASADMEELAWIYAENPDVAYAVPNYRWQTAIVPNDPLYPQQWSHQNMESESGWDLETGSNDVVVAIIDTGVDWNHPDLAANIWSNNLENSTNGIDDDANGYIDDIRGWDFVDVTQSNSFLVGEDIGPEDNDPMDFYGHGTVVAGAAGAVGSNGVGIAGVSWRCRIMPLRVGAAERDSGNAYILSSWIAEAVRYATDNGAGVINLSLVDINWPVIGSGPVKDAIDYAFSNDLVVVAAAGNYGVGYEVYPAAYHRVLGVAATDQLDRRSIWGTPQPPLWHGTSSSYGPWVSVAAPGTEILSTGYDDAYETNNGTSLAAPAAAGLAALIRSRHPEFSNEQVMKVISSTTDRPDSEKYMGTGRINVLQALNMSSVPEAEITFPAMDYAVSSNIDVIGTAGGTNFSSYSLQYARGIYPVSWSWIQYSTSGTTNGALGNWNVASLDDNAVYTIRLSVSDGSGNVSLSESVVVLQKNVQAGWPRTHAGRIRNDGIAIGDTDGDGDMEMAVLVARQLGPADYEYDLHVYHHDGTPAIGWPVSNLAVKTAGSPTIADVTMDGEAEIIISGYKLVSYPQYATKFFVYDKNGLLLAGWPQEYLSTNYYVSTSPSVGDMDNDGFPEIVFTSRSDSRQDFGTIHVFEPDGTLATGWPQLIELGFPPSHGTAQDQASHANLADLDADGDLELVTSISTYATSHVYAFHHDGSIVSGWPKTNANGYVIHTVCGDLDGNGDMEVIGSTGDGDLYAWNGDGSVFPGWPVFVPLVGGLTAPALADLDDDGDVEVVVHTKGDKNYAYHHDGSLVSGWPVDTTVYLGGGSWPVSLIGDIDGDHEPEVIQAAGDEAKVYAWHANGSPVTGWPLLLPEPTSVTPVIWDLDDDGQVELAVAYGETLNVYDLSSSFQSSDLQWPMIWGDVPRTALYRLPDADSDGLPDWWENFFFGGTTNADLAADDDFDGHNSWQEFIAGTIPADSTSVFQCFLSSPASDSGEGNVIRWSSESNRFYDLSRTENLVTGLWSFVVSDIPATPPENVYTDTVGGVGPYFYRTGVTRY